MRKKEWLSFVLILLIIAGAGFGLYTYKTSQTEKNQSAPTTAPQQTASSPALAEGTPSVKLWVTSDFGAKVLFDQQVAWHEGDTVMDLLKTNLPQVETAYNGGFVQSINGLASQYRVGDSTSKKVDWFYSVNGLMADVGAGEFPTRPGDIIWWDYHDWDYAMRVPAQIGAFPHPFLTRVTGEPLPVQIMYAGDHGQIADKLAKMLEQARQTYEKNQNNQHIQGSQASQASQKDQAQVIATTSWKEPMFEQEQGLILIGDRKSLLTSAFVQRMMKERDALGLFAGLTAGGIQLYDQAGKPGKLLTDEDDSLILGTKNLTTDMPVLIVAGNSDAALQKAVEKLEQTATEQTTTEQTATEQPHSDDSFQRMYEAVITDGKIERLPMGSNEGAKQ